jgi:hypothetical protein
LHACVPLCGSAKTRTLEPATAHAAINSSPGESTHIVLTCVVASCNWLFILGMLINICLGTEFILYLDDWPTELLFSRPTECLTIPVNALPVDLPESMSLSYFHSDWAIDFLSRWLVHRVIVWVTHWVRYWLHMWFTVRLIDSLAQGILSVWVTSATNIIFVCLPIRLSCSYCVLHWLTLWLSFYIFDDWVFCDWSSYICLPDLRSGYIYHQNIHLVRSKLHLHRRSEYKLYIVIIFSRYWWMGCSKEIF